MEELPGPEPFLRLEEPDQELLSKISRVTCRLLYVRERGGEEPQVFPVGSTGYEIPISHREPAYLLPDRALPEDGTPWQINLGWIENPRLVVVLNKTVWRGTTQPTLQQLEQVRASAIQLGFKDTHFPLQIAPGEIQPLALTPGPRVLFARAVGGRPIISLFAV